MQTSATMALSSNKVRFKVSMARLIRAERSYTASTVTPLGRLGAISARRSFTCWMTDSAFSPKRCSAMPETTSPSPFSSVMPRRSSGVSSTRATSLSSTGTPLSDLTTICSRSERLLM